MIVNKPASLDGSQFSRAIKSINPEAALLVYRANKGKPGDTYQCLWDDRVTPPSESEILDASVIVETKVSRIRAREPNSETRLKNILSQLRSIDTIGAARQYAVSRSSTNADHLALTGDIIWVVLNLARYVKHLDDEIFPDDE